MLMNIWLRTLLSILSFIVVSVAAANESQVRVGKQMIDLGELPSGRLAQISLWFPEGQCADLPNKQYCLADSATSDRTLVFSHGAMGAAENYNWIAEALAAAGYIVVGINHYGESWLYGEDTQDVRATSMIWHRPTDISAIYDALSNRELFQKPVNWSNIIALGHSSGGQTVAMLAGVQYDLLRMMDFCKTDAAKNDNSCNYGIRNAPKPGDAFLQKFGATYADTRVKKIIMIDPTLGYGATPESLANVQLPTLIVGAQNNDFLPWANHGVRYAEGIKNSKVHLLTGEEGHFIFLDACNSDILVMGVPLCKDRAGVDRAATHLALVPIVLEFVRENNITIDASKKYSEREKTAFNVEKITQILMYTPRWVFGLLAGLVILGLMQVRTRQVPIQAVFIMPVAMTMMSLIGALMDLGFTAITISCWLLGAVSVTMALLKVFKPSARCDQLTRKLILPGSWMPLLVIMAIFCTRYALGMTLGINLDIVHEIYFAPVMSFILGALSGYFIAEGFQYSQVIRRAESPVRV
jgi:predicted dienelactone hydrolase